MATIVNTPSAPAPTQTSDSGLGVVLGIILLVVVVAALIFYGLPYLRAGYSGTSVNVPDHVNVNVQHSGSSGGTGTTGK